MVTMTAIGNWGRFGNCLYQVAGIIGIARKNNHPFCFRPLKNYDHHERFGQKDDDINIDDHLVNPLPGFAELNYNKIFVDWGYMDIKLTDGAWDISGHFQSPKYFDHCMDEVRHYMRMKDEPEQNEFTALHLRCGDYERDPNAYHPVMNADYYKKAVQEFPPETRYLVFSDDEFEAKVLMKTLETLLERRINYTIVEGMDYLQSYKLMKKCKSFICANSSYSAFAATIAEHPEKKMVFPKRWFGANAGPLNGDDVYPENSIIL